MAGLQRTVRGYVPNKPKVETHFSELILIEEEIHTSHVTTSYGERSSRCHILELPIELIESLCREYIDVVTATALGLTCYSFFNITEHLYPYQVNLHMRTKGKNRKCLGHLLTDWMAPKYSFDHSWGIFRLHRQWRHDEDAVDKKWREKEGWKRIKLVRDKIGAVVAYESQQRGF